jgi:Tudor domain
LDVIYAVKHPELETCYRAKLTSIGTDEAVAYFIDYGDSATVPLSDIHTCPESVRDTPPMAIKCGLKLNVPDDFHWTPGTVRVLKAVAEEEETLEAVFCEEVDGMKLIRSLKTAKQNLIEVIEEAIHNSTNRPQEGEVDPPAEAVEQEMEPVSEECPEPSVANEQPDDNPNEETGADTDVGDVTTEHLPEVNVTLHLDADEGAEIVYPAVDAAEGEEHNSFDHSIGTDSGLAESAGNDFSEGLVSSRRNSVTKIIAKMESLIQARSNSPTSPTPDIVVSSRMPNVTATSVDSANKCEPIASTEPETIVDTCEVFEKEHADLGDCSHDTKAENREEIEVVPTTTQLRVVECFEVESATTKTLGDCHPQAIPVESHVSVYRSSEMEGIPTEEIGPCGDVIMQEQITGVAEEEQMPEIQQVGAAYVTEESALFVEEKPIPEIENPGAAIMQEESTVNAEEEPILQIEPDTSEDFETSNGAEQVLGSSETQDVQVVHSLSFHCFMLVGVEVRC